MRSHTLKTMTSKRTDHGTSKGQPTITCPISVRDDNHFRNCSSLATRLCPPPPSPSLVGAYYLHPPDARAIFLQSDLLCNGTCAATGGGGA